jgi:tRNA(Ile2) C34 agmatinyltransferase TiaS
MSLNDLTFLHKLRLRVLAILVGSGLAVFGLLSLVSWPALPVIGVAVITVAAVVHRVTYKLSSPLCHACGHDLTGQPDSSIGLICPDCGAVNVPLPSPQTRGSRRA